MKTIRNLFKDESGAAAVEYGLLVALIACVIIVGVGFLGTSLNNMFANVSSTIAAVGPSGGGGS